MIELPDGLTLRLARPADATAIGALMRASVEQIFPDFYDATQTATAAAYVAVPDHTLIEDGTYFVVQAPGGALAACGGWSRRLRLFAGAAASAEDGRLLDPATEPARVRAMFVDRAWTRRGLGTAILAACEDAARAAGFRDLELMATLPGVPLYRAWGFTGGDPQPIPYPSGVRLDGTLMRRPIAPR